MKRTSLNHKIIGSKQGDQHQFLTYIKDQKQNGSSYKHFNKPSTNSRYSNIQNDEEGEDFDLIDFVFKSDKILSETEKESQVDEFNLDN
jgi:hypothetical protein